MAATTATANEVTGCTKDDNEDKVRQGKAKRDEGRQGEMKGDKGRQREMILGTQEMNEMVKEGGQATRW